MPMTHEEIDAFLSEPLLAHFATIDPTGRPRVRPLWFLWEDGSLWFTTRRAARHTGRDLVANPAVAVSIASEERPYRAVLAHGTPQDVGPDEDKLRAIAVRYGREPGLRWLRTALREPDRTVLRLVPERLIAWDYGKGQQTDERHSVRT